MGVDRVDIAVKPDDQATTNWSAVTRSAGFQQRVSLS